MNDIVVRHEVNRNGGKYTDLMYTWINEKTALFKSLTRLGWSNSFSVLAYRPVMRSVTGLHPRNLQSPGCKALTHYKRPRCWETLRARGEGSNTGWDGWMASDGIWLQLTQWTWVWANSGRKWRTERRGMLQFMGSQKVGHYLVTEQQQQEHDWWKRLLGVQSDRVWWGTSYWVWEREMLSQVQGFRFVLLYGWKNTDISWDRKWQ